MEWSQNSSSQEDRRKLMQIGFAALLARKQVVQKQYLYEGKKDGGFVFEPVLRNNEPEMADEEYMRKKYYSQVVYEGTMDGSIDTTIQEGNPNIRAARRLWAGRRGTGWNGTGKGGYMASLQPGVPETQGTGLGSPRKESDLLMQVYLEKQANKMHILKGKSQQSTQDLFSKIAQHAEKTTGVADLSAKEYIPPPKDQGVSLKNYRHYVAPGFLPGTAGSEHGGSDAQKREWAIKAIRKLSSHNWGAKMTDSEKKVNMFTSYGFLQGAYAKKLLDTKPQEFLKPSDRRRLLDNNMYRQPAGGDREFAGQVSSEDAKLMGVGGLYHDWKTVDEFGDYEDRPDGQPDTKDSYKGGPSKYEGSDFSGDGGALTSNNMEIADAKLLKTTFYKQNVSELFPKSWQQYQKLRNQERNRYNIAAGQLLNQDLDVPQVDVKNEHEAERFVRWMQNELNAEQAKLNEIIPQYDDWGFLNWRDKTVSPTYSSYFMKDYAGTSAKSSGYSETHKFIRETYKGEYKTEILEGFLGDFGLLNDEVNYLMSNRFSQVKNPETEAMEWKWINRSQEDRGVDLYLPQDGGLLKIHVSARVVPATKKSRAYVKLDIPYPSKYNNFKGGVTFIPDVPYQFQDMEVLEMKGEENLESFKGVTEEFWNTGAHQMYMGAAMQTQSGYATRMFIGDTSPVNSVAFYTSTISTSDFADQLKDLVDIGAEYWWSDKSGFDSYFNLEDMEGGAFKEWALKWAEESKALQDKLNHTIEMKWKLWLDNYAGGGATAPAPRIANTWEGPLRLGPFVHSTKYLGQAQSVGRRPHGYYVQDDWEGGPLG